MWKGSAIGENLRELSPLASSADAYTEPAIKASKLLSWAERSPGGHTVSIVYPSLLFAGIAVGALSGWSVFL
jgi:hypothetical protein